jgi:tripartite-type tricarboxylate transporter receptor subunit TctC
VLHDPDFIKSFVQPQGFTAPNLTREQFAERVQSDYALWGQMVEKAGLKKKP